MPIRNNLEHQFSSLSTSDNTTTNNKDVTPAMVSPVKSEAGSHASVYSEASEEEEEEELLEEEEPQQSGVMLAQKTEHKLKEEQGILQDEDLLKANPYRFVLFPIQDNEVSTAVPVESAAG